LLQGVVDAGYTAIALGLIFYVLNRGRGKASMKVSIGEFKGPVYYVLVVIGLLLIAFGFL
jgi:hypothetical protein